jgi:WD40 repeat protein
VVRPRPRPKPETVSPRLLRTLVHPDTEAEIGAIGFSPDGERLLSTAFPPGAVQVWQAATGKALLTIGTPPGYLCRGGCLTLAPDGRTLFLPLEKARRRAGRWEIDGEIQVWDLVTGRQLPSLKPPPGRGGSWPCSLSPDGRTLALVEHIADAEHGIKGIVTFWDLPSRTQRDLVAGAAWPVFAPDWKTFASPVYQSEKHGILKLFDAASGEVRLVLGETRNAYFGLPAFSPDGQYVAAGLGTQRETIPEVRLWEVSSGKEVGSFAAPEIAGHFLRVAFSPDGRWLAARLYEGFVFLYDVPARKLARRYELGKQAGLGDAVFSPDGRWLAVAGQEIPDELGREERQNPEDLPQPRVFLFDPAADGEPEILVTPHGLVGPLAFSPDGRLLALGAHGRAWLFDMSQKRTE